MVLGRGGAQEWDRCLSRNTPSGHWTPAAKASMWQVPAGSLVERAPGTSSVPGQPLLGMSEEEATVV